MSDRNVSDPLLGDLSQEQVAAVCADFGVPLVIVAGPGSGKTLTLTRRVVYGMRKFNLSTQCVIVLTFGRNAAEEMRTRIAALCSSFSEDQLGALTIRTYHSFCFWMICMYRKWKGEKNRPILISQSQQRRLMQKCLRTLAKNRPGETRFIEAEIALGRVMREKSARKGVLPSDEPTDSKDVYQLWKLYELEKKQLDFVDLLREGVETLRTNPSFAALLCSRLRLICVDEFQDTNVLQLELILEIQKAALGSFLTVVGDDDQAIYGFRGSDSRIFAKFEKSFPRTNRKILSVNHRSTSSIVSFANRFISLNDQRVPKNLRSSGKSSAQSVPVSLMLCVDEPVEIVKMISRIQKSSGASWSDFAILCRYRRPLDAFLKALTSFSVPFNSLFVSELGFEESNGEGNEPMVRVKRRKGDRTESSENGVFVSTIHSSKGMEWRFVCIVGVERGICPSGISSAEEERRIAYVGITRGRERVFISTREGCPFRKDSAEIGVGDEPKEILSQVACENANISPFLHYFIREAYERRDLCEIGVTPSSGSVDDVPSVQNSVDSLPSARFVSASSLVFAPNCGSTGGKRKRL